MRAARFTGNGGIEIVETSRPRPAPGEVLVQVLACALCGSDLRPLARGWPVTPGHEIAGRVVTAGHPLEGRRVAVYIPVFCGRCRQCEAGNTQLCETSRDLVGWQRPGGYAEFAAVPAQCLIPVPDDIPTALAPLVLDTIGTVAHGLRKAAALVGKGDVLVIGAGPIGLGAVLAAQGLGFGAVHVSEPGEHRRQVAAELGALPVEPADTANRFHIVVEASGKDPGRQTALEAVAPGGAVVQLGESDGWTIEENRTIRLKDFVIARTFYFPLSDAEANFDLLRRRQARYARLVDARAGLDELAGLYAAFKRGALLKPQYAVAE